MNRIILLLAAAVFVGTGCDESNLLVKNDTPVRVNGIVNAIECPFWTPIVPYAAEYQHYATLRFVRDDGTLYFARTDDASLFAVSIDTGTYSIILESGHTFPDTLRDIRLMRDTVLDVLLTIDYLSADTINFNFYYDNLSDSLGIAAEMEFLANLNDWLHGALKLSGTSRKEYGPTGSGSGRTSYRSPILNDKQVWYISQSIRYLIDNGIVTEPASFSAYPDYYFCLN